MSEAILVRDGLPFGGHTIDGDVLIPVIDGYEMKAATKKRPYPTMTFTVIIPPALCPSTDDVQWLQPGHSLDDVRIVMVFKAGSLKREDA